LITNVLKFFVDAVVTILGLFPPSRKAA
jgi:hypothetical protein